MGSIAADIYGGAQSAAASRAQGLTQYEIGNQNASIADYQARTASARGGFGAGLARMKGSSLAGAQTTAYASGGVDSSVGTAAKTILDTKAMSDLDANIIKNNAAREAWGYKVQGTQDREQAQLALISGNNAAKATLLTAGVNAGTDLMNLATKIGGSQGSLSPNVPTGSYG